MATLLKVLNNLADIKSAGGVALRVRTQARAVRQAVAAGQASRVALTSGERFQKPLPAVGRGPKSVSASFYQRADWP
jgi:hypothetical protein